MKQVLEYFQSVSLEEWFIKVESELKAFAKAELANSEEVETERYALDRNEYQWKASEIITVKDAKIGNQQIEAALINGIAAPVLVIDEPMTVRQLEDLLDEIPLHYAAVNFEVNDADLVKTFLSKLYKSKGLWTNLKGTFTIKTASGIEITRLIEQVNAVLPQFKLLSINAQKHYKGKSQTTEELANTLLEADQVFKKLIPHDLSENRIQQQIAITFNIDNHIFTSIAKIKAFRQLWLRFAKMHDVAFPLSPAIHLRTLPSLETQSPEKFIIQTILQAIAGIVSEGNQIVLTASPQADLEDNLAFTRAIHEAIKAAYEFPFYKKTTKTLDYINEMSEQLAKIAWQKFEEAKED